MLKKAVLLFIFLVFIFPSKVFAADRFASSYDVTFDINSEGITQVNEKITLRNLTDDYYADQFKLNISSTQVYDVKASDSTGPLKTTVEKKDTGTSITIKLSQQVVGLNKEHSWNLQFKSKDFTQKSGKVWEITAPKISSTVNLDNYGLTIMVPKSFGDLTSIAPTPKSDESNGAGKRILKFDKNQLISTGVSASFGNIQLFDFALSYHLENTNFIPILTSIALPPDTSYQDVSFTKIQPQPLNVTVDEDGNYLAWYRLNKGDKLDVLATGSARLYIKTKVKNPILPDDLKQKYLQADKYWEKDDPDITQKVDKILGQNPPASTKEKAKLIYKAVVDSLTYDRSKLTPALDLKRQGALGALNNPTAAVCMEFTDLFIAMARAAGIPARELDGYAYTANSDLRPLSLSKDILHAWPEYFDEKIGWIMVDPTWENTTGGVDYFNKLDLSHFVFATRGTSSQTPYAAGSYKYNGQDSKDVSVNFGENDFVIRPKVEVDIDVNDPILAGFPMKLKIKVKNSGNSILPISDFIVGAHSLDVKNTFSEVGPVPAFGYADFEMDIRSSTLFDTFMDKITLLVGKQKFSREVEVKPFIIFQKGPLTGIGVVAALGSIYLAILGVFTYRRRFMVKKGLQPPATSLQMKQKS